MEWPQLEVVVCAGGDDGTPDIAKRYAIQYPDRVVFLEQHRGEGKQRALRRAFQQARGDVLYLTDADCVVPADTLSALVDVVGFGKADVATGPADPFPEQRSSPWVRHQWATVRAVDRIRPRASTGILGRNCAARRDATEAAGAFAEPVRIGTDYHFAKKMLESGGAIHFVPVPVQTEYAEGFGAYLRQQSRWMRNILIHGPRFGDWSEVAGVGRTVVLGWMLLVWPFTWRWTKLPGIALWLVPLGWMTRVRFRQQRALEAEERDLPHVPGQALVARAALFSVVDLVVWARPGLDLLSPHRRHLW